MTINDEILRGFASALWRRPQQWFSCFAVEQSLGSHQALIVSYVGAAGEDSRSELS